jgi:hypothetical protein
MGGASGIFVRGGAQILIIAFVSGQWVFEDETQGLQAGLVVKAGSHFHKDRVRPQAAGAWSVGRKWLRRKAT